MGYKGQEDIITELTRSMKEAKEKNELLPFFNQCFFGWEQREMRRTGTTL